MVYTLSMRSNKGQTINQREWNEIMAQPVVEKFFEIRSFERWDDFAARVYGAKFMIDDGISETYILYTLVGEYNKGDVLMLKRVNGHFIE